MSERFIVILFLLSTFVCIGRSQSVGLRTNTLYWLTTTPNVGVDVYLGGRSTLTGFVGYNPFRFSNRSVEEAVSSPKLMHWVGSAEYKYWFCHPYERWFVGAHGVYSDFNIGGLSLPFLSGLKDARYEGTALGGGLTCGYQLAFARRWGLEASLGLGYLRIRYSKYGSDPCGGIRKAAIRNWLGPTKLSLSVVYYIY